MEKLEVVIDTENWSISIGKDVLILPPSEIPRRIQVWAGNSDCVDVVLGYKINRNPVACLQSKRDTKEALKEFINKKEYEGRIEFGLPPNMYYVANILFIKKPATLLVI